MSRDQNREKKYGAEEIRLSFEGPADCRRVPFDRRPSFASGLGAGLSVGETERARGWRVRKFISGRSGTLRRRFECAPGRAVDVVGRLSRDAICPPLRWHG